MDLVYLPLGINFCTLGCWFSLNCALFNFSILYVLSAQDFHPKNCVKPGGTNCIRRKEMKENRKRELRWRAILESLFSWGDFLHHPFSALAVLLMLQSRDVYEDPSLKNSHICANSRHYRGSWSAVPPARNSAPEPRKLKVTVGF